MSIKCRKILFVLILTSILPLSLYIFYKYNKRNTSSVKKKKQVIYLKNDGTIFFKESNNKNIKHEKLVIDNENMYVDLHSNYKQCNNVFKRNNMLTLNYSDDNNLNYKFYTTKNFKEIVKNASLYKKYCQFCVSSYLTSKKLLFESYKKIEKLFPEDYNFFIETYILPNDLNEFKKNFKNNDLWIVKPYNLSRGREVKVINNLKYVPKNCVISKYLKPHLIFGKKYDIRMTLLITSYDPLIIYLYTDGVLRFATHPYRTDSEYFLEDEFMHLTNNCVNVKSRFYKRNSSPETLAESLCSLKSFKKYCKENNIDYDKIMEKVKDYVIKCVLSGYDDAVKNLKDFNLPSSKNCFELFGVDIIIDENLEPHLLEFNLNPSLEFNCKAGDIIYNKILVDTLNLIGMKPYDKTKKYKSLSTEERFNENIDEFKRDRGGFELIFPLKNNIDKYKKFIKSPGNLNLMVWNYIFKN